LEVGKSERRNAGYAAIPFVGNKIATAYHIRIGLHMKKQIFTVVTREETKKNCVQRVIAAV
jgi:hypothetical protein